MSYLCLAISIPGHQWWGRHHKPVNLTEFYVGLAEAQAIERPAPNEFFPHPLPISVERQIVGIGLSFERRYACLFAHRGERRWSVQVGKAWLQRYLDGEIDGYGRPIPKKRRP